MFDKLPQKNRTIEMKPLVDKGGQRETMSVQKEDQPYIYSGLPEHWHLHDPFDEVYFSEVIKKELDEKAYIIYCVDTYNTYRLPDDQKEMFESFDNSVLNNIRTNMYSRNEIVRRFKQNSL